MKQLTLRQQEVIDLVVKGLSNQEVANQLFIDEKTVKFHLTAIYKILSLKSRAELIIKYMRDQPTVQDFSEFESLNEKMDSSQ